MSNDPIKVLDEKCVGCSLCAKSCPFGAIVMEDRLARIDLTKCTLCGACVEACRFDAIEMKQKDGTIDVIYAHWILGQGQETPEPRWSIARDVLGWMD